MWRRLSLLRASCWHPFPVWSEPGEFQSQQRWRSLESTVNSQPAVGDVGAIRPLRLTFWVQLKPNVNQDSWKINILLVLLKIKAKETKRKQVARCKWAPDSIPHCAALQQSLCWSSRLSKLRLWFTRMEINLPGLGLSTPWSAWHPMSTMGQDIIQNPSTFICLSLHVEFIHTYLYNSIYSCCYFIITSSDLVSSCYRLAFLVCFLVLSSALPTIYTPGPLPHSVVYSILSYRINSSTYVFLSEFFLPLLTLLCQCFVYSCSTLSPPISFPLIWFYLSLAHLFLSYLFPAFPAESQHIIFALILSCLLLRRKAIRSWQIVFKPPHPQRASLPPFMDYLSELHRGWEFSRTWIIHGTYTFDSCCTPICQHWNNISLTIPPFSNLTT